MPSRRSLKTLMTVAACGLAMLTPIASAQAEKPPRPEGDVGDGFGGTVVRMGLGIVVVGAVVFASVFPSKRGHQD